MSRGCHQQSAFKSQTCGLFSNASNPRASAHSSTLMSVQAPYMAHYLPVSPSLRHCLQGRNLASSIALPKPPSASGYSSTTLGHGLRTPPVDDDMSATYQPAMTTYGSHNVHAYPVPMAHASHIKPVMDDARVPQPYRYPSQQLLAQNGTYSSPLPDSSLHQAVMPATPLAEVPVPSKRSDPVTRRGSETLIYHSLQLPKCISPTGGNLSDFAAQMTCLFWFESIEELKNAETMRPSAANIPISRLPALARPHDQFLKWIYNVLSTTQVTQNVIFLALLFIYRLKMSTPQIKGRAGSEYRLLTVALMLGNKFLDDNTYTNKTWAEVSCFAVQEIHVMEVEFLSNMRYNLLASKDEWEQWITKLSCFHEYYQRASKLPASPVHKPSPTHRALHSPLPSPTATGMPPSMAAVKCNLSPSSRHSRNTCTYQANATSPLAGKVSIPLPRSRKRSPDGYLAEHPAKRHVFSAAPSARPPNATLDKNMTNSNSNRLPVPHLTVATNQQYVGGITHAAQSAGTASQQMVSLPPLQPGVRALSTMYQVNPSVGLVQAQPVGAVTSTTPAPRPMYPVPTLATQAPIGFGTPTKHHSPGRVVASYGSSPLVESFGQTSAIHTPVVHTPISNSPSVYLQHRASPYKPIRHVNRLLYPPPSASLDQYHISVPVQPNQMHYQPLGRRHDLRTGIVPEFLVYNRGQYQQQIPSQGMLQLQQQRQGHYPV